MSKINKKRKPTSSPVLNMPTGAAMAANASQAEPGQQQSWTAVLERIDRRLTNIETQLGVIPEIKKDVKQLRKDVDKIREDNIELDLYTRRQNIILFGVGEKSKGSSLYDAVTRVLKDALGVDISEKVESLYRIGGKATDGGKPRPILIKFDTFKGKMEVFGGKGKLGGTGLGMIEDYPKCLSTRRKLLLPALRMAKKKTKEAYIRRKGTDFVLYVDHRKSVTASDLEGDSDEARELREHFERGAEVAEDQDSEDSSTNPGKDNDQST